MNSPILIPAVVLVLWSLMMLAWVAISRLPAMSKAGVSLATNVGGRGADLEGVLAGADSATNVMLAWVYVSLRIVHSLVQALWNRVAVRFLLFLAATGALVLMAVNALLALIG